MNRGRDDRCGVRPFGAQFGCQAQHGHDGRHVWHSSGLGVTWRWDGGDAPDAPRRKIRATTAVQRTVTPPSPSRLDPWSNNKKRRAERDLARLEARFGYAR